MEVLSLEHNIVKEESAKGLGIDRKIEGKAGECASSKPRR